MTARLRRPERTFMKSAEAMAQADDFHQRIRALEALAAGLGIFEIKVDEDLVTVTARDGAFKFDIPSDLDESMLVDIEAWVTAVSTSGDVVVSLWNQTQGHDMLSTPVTIEANELNDKDAATQFVINVANAQVAYGDELWINVDNAGSGAAGLGVAVKFAPAATAAIVLAGAQGPPGGVTSFQGAWQNTTIYHAGDVITHNGILYVALQDHTSNSANDEPGVGTNWEDFWTTAFDIPMGGSINLVVTEGSGNDIAAGQKGAVVIPFDATITSGMILAESAGDAVVDIWKSDFGGYPPSSGDSITGGNPLTLTGSLKNLDTTLTGWDTSLLEGDILVFDVSGVVAIQRLTVALTVEKV